MRKLKRENNDGFSLVEVLVSVAIIAVVLLPLVAGFSNTSTSTRKLKTIQKGTTLAQNVMEKVKEDDMDDIKYQFFSSKGLTGYTVESSYESNPTNPGTALGSSDASCFINDAGNVSYRNRKDGKYSFVYQGVADGSDKYDVVVSMDASSYYSNDPSVKDFNDVSLGSISGLDAKRTAVISTTSEIKAQAIEYFVAHDYGTEDYVSANMTVAMDITMEGDDSREDGTMLLTASPTYVLHAATEDYMWCPGLVYQKSYYVSDAIHLEKIYVLYSQSPYSNRIVGDEITINVTSDSNLGNRIHPTLIIVKQNNGGVADINRNLNIWSTNNDMFNDIITDVRGNMTVNYLNKSNDMLKVVDSVTHATNGKATADYINYTYVDSDDILMDTSTSGDPDDHSDNRVYDLTVTVYKSGSDFSDVVATLTSTRRE